MVALADDELHDARQHAAEGRVMQLDLTGGQLRIQAFDGLGVALAPAGEIDPVGLEQGFQRGDVRHDGRAGVIGTGGTCGGTGSKHQSSWLSRFCLLYLL